MSSSSRESFASRLLGQPLAWLGAVACAALALFAMRPELGGSAREIAIAVIAAVGVAALVAVIGRGGGRNRGEARAQILTAAIEADDQARLVIDGDGREIMRNGAAETLFGSADDPAAPLIARVGSDERAAEEIGRLTVAARQGG